jgi:hypothetical protein
LQLSYLTTSFLLIFYYFDGYERYEVVIFIAGVVSSCIAIIWHCHISKKGLGTLHDLFMMRSLGGLLNFLLDVLTGFGQLFTDING